VAQDTQGQFSKSDEPMKQTLLVVAWICTADSVHVASSLRAATQKPKLELGFTGFNKNLTLMLSQEVNNSAAKFKVPERLRPNLTAEIVTAVEKGLGDQLKPLKQSIAKTWVQLKDASRDHYADAVKSGFEPLFMTAAKSITLHAGIGVQRAANFINENPGKKDAELLAESLKVVEDDLFSEHCHLNDKKEKYCIPSPIKGFETRLHDAEGLVGMSIKFESGGMVFIQKEQKDSVNHK
jgi:hypothetical protein